MNYRFLTCFSIACCLIFSLTVSTNAEDSATDKEDILLTGAHELDSDFVAGACSVNDQQSFINPGNTNFTPHLRRCAQKELGDRDNTVACLRQILPSLSLPCANCFGDTVACTKDHCWFDCMFDDQSAGCKSCSTINCGPALEQCTGVTKDNLPPC